MEAGFLTKNLAARVGRVVKSPPQFGHAPPGKFRTQAAQNVHSNEQIKTSRESGGRSTPQHSQNGLSSNISLVLFL